ERLGEKAARVGFDWSTARAVLDKVHEELVELDAALEAERVEDVESEVGDCLFALASLARKCGVSAELALRRALDRFVDRFRFVEHELERQGRSAHDASLEEMEALWRQAKRR